MVLVMYKIMSKIDLNFIKVPVDALCAQMR